MAKAKEKGLAEGHGAIVKMQKNDAFAFFSTPILSYQMTFCLVPQISSAHTPYYRATPKCIITELQKSPPSQTAPLSVVNQIPNHCKEHQ